MKQGIESFNRSKFGGIDLSICTICTLVIIIENTFDDSFGLY